MNAIVAAVIIAASLTSYGQATNHVRQHIALPNPKLVRCVSSSCYWPWQDGPPDANDVYPTRVEIGFHGSSCPFGVTARYDKSVSFEDLEAAIEQHYGKGESEHWTRAPLMIWHVETVGVMITLETVDKRMAKAQRVEVGTKNVIYTDSQVPTKCSSQ
jgi:hypothetical protein